METVKKLTPVLFLFFFTFLFFSNLFFKKLIFLTPDYGRSDFANFNIPMRILTQQSMKHFHLPLWTEKIGQGYPLFDEGQSGALYLPNIILSFAFPFWLAFNLGFVFTIFWGALGTYLFIRSQNLNRYPALIAALTFSFSAIFPLHFQHYNLIQTASIMPWYFWLINSYFSTKRPTFLFLLPVFVAQQIFAGFPQITFYSLFGLCLFFIFKLKTQTKTATKRIKTSVIFFLLILLGFVASSVQLLATSTLTEQSARISKLDTQSLLSEFPYKPQNILTVFSPYILGTPKDASYKPWAPPNWGIFWESNSYFGVIQLILASSFLIYLLVKKDDKQRKNVLFWIFFGALGLLLALGTAAPLHPLFSIPPFSYFRVPARFLIFSFFAAATICSFAAEKLSTKKWGRAILYLALVLICIDIFKSWHNYHMTVKKDDYFKTPQIGQNIPQMARIFALNPQKPWNKTFLQKGWENQQDFYLFQKNFLAQNANISFQKTSTLVYGGITSRRQQLTELLTNYDFKDDNQIFTIKRVSQNTLDFTSTEYLTSSQPIISQNLQFQKSTTAKDQTIYLYKNKTANPRVFAPQNYLVANSLQDVIRILQNEQFNPKEAVILEKEIALPKQIPPQQGQIRIISDQDTKVEIESDLQNDGLVVLTDSFYPGWTATIDGNPTEIFATNINSRSTIVPKGTHKIIYSYNPRNLKLALYLSLSGHFAIFLLLLLSQKKKALF